MDLQIAALRMDKSFFNALLEGDVSLLTRLLSDDFVLIDVMSGAENTKQAMLDGIGSREVRFESIRPSCVRVRSYERTAVVTGRTHMTISIGDSQFGGHGDRLRQPRAGDELHHHRRRRGQRLVKAQQVMTRPFDQTGELDR